MSKMHSAFIQEQKRYSQSELRSLFNLNEEKTVGVLRKLKEYGVVKIVKKTDGQRDLTDLQDTDIEVSTVNNNADDFYYVFTFVGVVIVMGIILKCYPKYIFSSQEPINELKLVVKTLEKYSHSRGELVKMYSDSNDSSSYNMLAVILYLITDYHENGVYSKEDVIIESNGMGEILWDRTINDTFALISRNRPYYSELKTYKEVDDEYDYFKRLHECILTKCSRELISTDLTSIFEDISPVDLTDECVEDFGEKDYVLYRIEQELNVQFNTHKQIILKILYTYISQSSSLADVDCFSMFGTNSFAQIWEDICQSILDDKLQKKLRDIPLPSPLKTIYNADDKLIDVIEKPKWKESSLGTPLETETLIPDIISIQGNKFMIFDAKYYVLRMVENVSISGQPGIESITKQYLYQLAYKKFIVDHDFNIIRNCFLMPTEDQNVINKGIVYMDMLSSLGLEPIQVRLIPARKVYNLYITNKKLDLNELEIF